jgi:hypothetical protein
MLMASSHHQLYIDGQHFIKYSTHHSTKDENLKWFGFSMIFPIRVNFDFLIITEQAARASLADDTD